MRTKILSTLMTVFLLVILLPGTASPDKSIPAVEKAPAAAAATGVAPRLVFDEMEHDFGEIKQQEEVKHIFKFRNEGDALLVVEEVKPSCGCTGTLLSAEKIPPGGEGEIEVTFKSGRSSGKKKKYISVISNDPSKPVEKIYIMADIVVPVEIRPRQIYWVADKDESSEKLVEITYKPELSINIVKLELSSDAFKASATPKGEGNRPGYDIDILFDGSLPTGRFTEKLTVTTDNEEYPSLSVIIRGQVTGKVKVVPGAVALGVIKDGELPSRAIRVYVKDNRDFEITAIEPSNPLITTEITKNTKTSGYSVKVSLNARPPTSGAFSENIRIKTSVAPDAPIEIAVYAYVQ